MGGEVYVDRTVLFVCTIHGDLSSGNIECNDFYRAMHFSAERGIAIACRLSVRLSVRPSVTLVNCDYIGWKSSIS